MKENTEKSVRELPLERERSITATPRRYPRLRFERVEAS
jgi:hypothetical protein